MQSIINPSNEDNAEQENDLQIEDFDIDDDFKEEEVLRLSAEMDAINAALDKIEKQNDEINKQLRKYLKESREKKDTVEGEATEPKEEENKSS